MSSEKIVLSPSKNHGQPLHVFVLIDALGWECIKKREFLTQSLPYRTPLRTVLGFSSGAIPTILTGVPPAQNGHWNLFYYDPKNSPFRWLRRFDFLPDRVINHRITTKLLKELGQHVLGMGSMFDCMVSPRLLPWFNFTEKRNIYARGGITGSRSIFDRLAECGIPHHIYSYHTGSDDQIISQARKDMAPRDTKFFFLYLSGLDMFLHTHCIDQVKLDERFAWYAARLQQLLEYARSIDPEARFSVFSDHGMTPVRHHFDLMTIIEALPFRMPHDYLAIYDSTMARFWCFSGTARREIMKQLGGIPCGRVLGDEELRQLGVLFEDRRYGEIVFLLHPGWLLARSNFNGSYWTPAGMHGYHPDDSYSDAVFLSNHKPPVDVRTLADVYQCMVKAVF